MYLKDSKIIVIKIGSSLLIDDKKKIRKKWLTEFAKDILELIKDKQPNLWPEYIKTSSKIVVENIVQQEQIILQRAGNREALEFGKSKFNPKAEVRTKIPAKAANQNRNIESINDIKGLIEQNMENALKDFGIETNEGRGYKIGNLSSNPYLQQAGLRPGDIILSVNGQPLGELQKDQLEFDNILAQGSASIELERGGEQMTITARLPNKI